MNDLQLGLIGLGTVAVIGVVAYNKWQEHRHRKVAEQLLQRGHEDVLLGGREIPEVRFADDDGGPPMAAEPALAEDAGWREAAPTPDVAPVRKSVHESALNSEPFIATPSESFAGQRQEPVLHDEPVLTEIPASDSPASAPVAEAHVAAEPPPATYAHEAAAAMPAAGKAASVVAIPAALAAEVDDEGVPAILVSSAIDFVARLELIDVVAGERLLDGQRELLARIEKPIGWAGFNDRLGQWETVTPAGMYRRVRVGLLLADRRGPLGEADLLTFIGAMQALAGDLAAALDLPAMEPALNAAIALDQFCANVDIQIGLNLIGQGQVFPGTKIRALAEAAGMVLDDSGRFARCDDDGNVLYTLANQESAGFSAETMRTLVTHGLCFSLDVPRVAHGDRVFAQMLDVARRMADTLHGVLVDDNRRPLTEAMLDPFRRQIGEYQSQLAARGMAAGGPLALRLFF